MAIKYLSNVDFGKNQLINIVVHVATSNPGSPVDGQLYYNSSDNKLYLYAGSTWIDVSGDIKSITSNNTDQLTVTNPNGPNPGLNVVTGQVTNGGSALATGDQIYDFVNGFVDNAKLLSLLSNLESASGAADETITIGTDAGDTISFSGNVTVTGNLTVSGTTTTVNSTTVTVVDPIFTLGSNSSDDNKDRGIEFKYNDGSARVGFFGFDDSTGKFTVLTQATNSSEVFSGTKGSLDIGSLDLGGSITTYDGANPTDGQLLIGHGSNSDLQLGTLTGGNGITVTNGAGSISIATSAASASAIGGVQLATTAEALAGTNTTKAVTPEGLAARSFAVNLNASESAVASSDNITYTVTHDLNTRDVICQVVETGSPYETINVDIARASTTTVTVVFASAVTAGDYKILITKID